MSTELINLRSVPDAPDATPSELQKIIRHVRGALEGTAEARAVLVTIPGPTAAVLLRQLDESAGRLRLVRDVCAAALAANRKQRT